MKFVEVEISNFLSIKEAKLDLSKPGLYLVNGKNNDDPSFSSNGSGKTSLFDAITYCLFGRLTNKELTQDELIHEGTDRVSISVVLEDDDGTLVTVNRSRSSKKNSSLRVFYTKTGEDLFISYSVTNLQSKLEEWLGIDYLTFSNSIFFGKGLSRFFVALDDSERKAILDSILRTVSFDKALEYSKELLSETLKDYSEVENNYLVTNTLYLSKKESLSSKTTELEKVISFLETLKDSKLEELKEIRLNKQSLQENLATITARLKELREDSAQSREVVSLRKENEKAVNSCKVSFNKECEKEVSKEEDKFTSFKTAYDTELKESQDSLKTLNSLRLDAEKEIQKRKEEETLVRLKLSNLETNIKELSSLKDYKSCPMCKQDLDYEKAKPLIKQKQEEYNNLKYKLSEILLDTKAYKDETVVVIDENITQLKEYSESLRLNFYDKKSEFNKTVEEIKNKYFTLSLEKVSELNSFYKDKIQHIMSTISEEVGQLDSERKTSTLEISILSEKEKAIETEFNHAQNSVTTLEVEVKGLKKEVDTLSVKLTKLKEDKEVLLERKEIFDFWVEGFGNKGIKSFILETSFPYLNERANYYSSFLTGGSVVISISPTITAKTTGNVKEKIVITAINAYGANVYSGQSDGERRRIDLCILLALKDLIALRAKRSFSLMVLDEIGDSLDTAGIERMVSVFREISRDKAIFVISHNEQLKQFFDQTLLIVKSGGESRLQ